MTRILLIIITLLVYTTFPCNAKSLTKKNSKLVKMTVSTASPKRRLGRYYWEDKRQSITSKLKIRNQNNYKIDKIKLELYIFGQNLQEKKYFTILKSDKQSISIKSKEEKEAILIEFSNIIDKRDYKHGYEYYGYVAVMRSAEGHLAQTASNRNSFVKLLDKFSSFDDKEFTLKGSTRSRRFHVEDDS